MVENKFLCPECREKLIKNVKNGEGVLNCPNCLSVWFIIKVKKGKNISIEPEYQI
jgi:Zn-finger nucleic acid-binding protein